ncbi:MAG TPA: sugar ABC transporter permease [Bacillota bacterium]|nr:sugar ABC transporter permease [Bacillota bacterium]HPE38034.1 sugar ABC transporter permease [Bacillota bacterium]
MATHEYNPEKARQRRIRGKRKKSIREWFIFTGYLAPSLIGVMLFFFGPIIIILFNSFQRSATNTTFVGTDNYVRVWNNQAFQTAGKNTLIFAALAVPLAVILSLLLALLLSAKIPGRSMFRSILLNPMMVPVASIVLIWQVMFSYSGALNTYLGWFGIDKIDWMKSGWSQIVILILFLWKNLGYNMVLFLSAINAVPVEILESAKMDGANSVRRFFSIKLAYLWPTIFFVGIMSLINSFKVFREIYLLTGDYPYDTLYMLQHYMNNMFKHFDYARLTASSIIMCIVMIVIVGVLFFFENRLGRDVEE